MKKLKRKATPEEDQQSQITGTHGRTQTLIHNQTAQVSWPKAPNTYIAEDYLVWHQWEATGKEGPGGMVASSQGHGEGGMV